jgi:hypothetical protein
LYAEPDIYRRRIFRAWRHGIGDGRALFRSEPPGYGQGQRVEEGSAGDWFIRHGQPPIPVKVSVG